MEMSLEHRIAASREQVWAALNDVATLRAAIPGCDELEATSPTSFKAAITTKVGPVKAKFKFDVTLTEIDAPNSYTIIAEGQGGAAGFANGSAAVTLRADGNDTILAYHAKANVGGKLAQLGGRLIDGTAKKLADEFFGKFSELAANPALLEGVADPADAQTAAAKAGSDAKLPTWLWALSGGCAAVLVYLLLT